MFAHTPGLKVVAPSTPLDAYGLLKTAIRDDDPVLFVENLVLYNVSGALPEPGDDFTVPIGRAQVVREGRDLTIIAHSYTVRRALTVADRLSQHGIEVEVVDLRSLRPLDAETICTSVAKTSRALVAEEGWATYGVGAEVAARISRECFDDLDAPVFYLQCEIDMAKALALREELNDELAAEGVKLTVNDLIVRASALALRDHPQFHRSWVDGKIHQHGAAHVGIAVALDEGLIVPVIRNADSLSLRDLAITARDLVGRARSGSLKQNEIEGGTFSVSNLGMLGITSFQAIINPPSPASSRSAASSSARSASAARSWCAR